MIDPASIGNGAAYGDDLGTCRFDNSVGILIEGRDGCFIEADRSSRDIGIGERGAFKINMGTVDNRNDPRFVSLGCAYYPCNREHVIRGHLSRRCHGELDQATMAYGAGDVLLALGGSVDCGRRAGGGCPDRTVRTGISAAPQCYIGDEHSTRRRSSARPCLEQWQCAG